MDSDKDVIYTNTNDTTTIKYYRMRLLIHYISVTVIYINLYTHTWILYFAKMLYNTY